MAIHEPLPGSQQKQHRGLWIALSIIGGALILILIGIVTVLLVSNNSATKKAPPVKKRHLKRHSQLMPLTSSKETITMPITISQLTTLSN